MGLVGLSIVAAIGRNRELGKDGRLLWRIPDDMGRFRMLTMGHLILMGHRMMKRHKMPTVGHPVIMGRKTWRSLPEKFRPLPGRMNIVVTRRAGYEARDAVVVGSFEAAYAMVIMCREVFVIGGGELYAAALPYANRLYLTLVEAEAEADTFFPPYKDDFHIVAEESGTGDPPHRFLVLERKMKSA